MITRKLQNISLALIFALAIVVAGCSTGSNSGMGTLKVLMHDAPIDSADAVNVFIERVEVNNTQSEEGWQIIAEPKQSYDLLELTNGAYTVLGEAQLEAGTYPQLRLILSQTGHTVEINGTVYDMKVPSGAQTGVKLNVNAEIEEDVTYRLLLDFDASRSVVKAGQNNPAVQYLLKPVIRAANQAETGNIAGTVSPAEVSSVVYAIADTDTLASTVPNETDGTFKLIGLDAGTYTVSVDPADDSGYAITDENDVSVTLGATNDIGTVELNQN